MLYKWRNDFNNSVRWSNVVSRTLLHQPKILKIILFTFLVLAVLESSLLRELFL